MKSFSLHTKLYLLLTYLAGILIFASHIQQIDITKPWLLTTLCVLASLTLILKVEGATNRSHYTFSFLVYAFTFSVYGLSEAILVIVVSNIVEWIWNKPPWFIQLFNLGGYVLVMQAAGNVYAWINPASSPDTGRAVLATIAGMATFNGLNHLMVGIVIWFARGESIKKSGVFDYFPFMLDLALLYFGASLSIVWNHNPFALVLFLIPLYLLYSTLRVPALERKTETDNKTGLFNQEYFKKQLMHELTRANRFDRPLSVIMADLDLLRNINNTYGHLAGDEVLIGVANTLKHSVREYDVVSRFGGEEFAILLPETTLAQAYERAEIIRKTIENYEFTVPTSVTPIRVTMSFGIAHREDFSQSPDEITHNADTALYHSKLSGRNRSYAYNDDAYINFMMDGSEEQADSISVHGVLNENKDLVVTNPIPSKNTAPSIPDEADSPLKTDLSEPEYKESERNSRSINHGVGIFITILAAVSLLSFAAVLRWIPFFSNFETYDWMGIIVISILIILSEAFSIDLHFRQTSVSTSAIPILVAYSLFEPAGVVCASLILAMTLVIKYRSRFSRFIFNFSNHILAGAIFLWLVLLTGEDFLRLSIPNQFILSMISAAILYLVTTWMVAIGMSLDLKQSALQIWREQFSWLAPYYAGIGFIAYSMAFGYKHNHITGIMLMVVPMVLLRISQKQYIDRTRQVVTELREKNQTLKKNSDEINDINEGLLLTLSEIIDLRDPYVLGHSKQVSKYAEDIAKLLNLGEKRINRIRQAGLLHDIGKLGIPTEILNKPAKLTLDEYEVVKRHAALGGEIIKNSPSLLPLVPIIRHHHEYYNGMGYPDKLAGNQIPIEARIVAVADAVEAMISDRQYRKSIKLEEIIEELNRNSGSQFDPIVTNAAVKMLQAVNRARQQNANMINSPIPDSQKFALQEQTA